jgi:hypothetical protein
VLTGRRVENIVRVVESTAWGGCRLLHSHDPCCNRVKIVQQVRGTRSRRTGNNEYKHLQRIVVSCSITPGTPCWAVRCGSGRWAITDTPLVAQSPHPHLRMVSMNGAPLTTTCDGMCGGRQRRCCGCPAAAASGRCMSTAYRASRCAQPSCTVSAVVVRLADTAQT